MSGERQRTIYFGPPGTGKTTTLLERLEGHLRDGVPPDRIAFLTFTRRARTEALERVQQVLGIHARDLPFFRTIHSMAFRALRLSQGDVIGRTHLDEFAQSMGVKFGQSALSEMAAEGVASDNKGDVLMALDNMARLRGVPLRQVWSEATRGEYPFAVVDHFARSYFAFKREHALLDFTDVLSEFARSSIELPVDVAMIDEAQDLSPLQWLAALQAAHKARVQYVAGDDDQAIYRWAGADVREFIALPGERVVLQQSHRLPRAVHALAAQVVARIRERVPKQFESRAEEGAVVRHTTAEAITVAKDERWLWLVRNRYLLPTLAQSLEQRGIVYSRHGLGSSINDTDRLAIYTWERLRAGRTVTVENARTMYSLLRTRAQVAHGQKLLPAFDDTATVDLAQLRAAGGLLADGVWFDVFDSIPMQRRLYYRRLLAQHRTLQLAPQVTLETIHGAKGAEAPHVALFLDQSRRTWEEAQRAGDDEHRVWYVGVTRARERLHIVESSNRYRYEMPRNGQNRR